jgi:hypothetical protein
MVLAVRCCKCILQRRRFHSEEAPEKPRRAGLSKNHSVCDPSNHYYLIFVIDIKDRPTEHQTPRFRKAQESIRLDGGIKLESNTKIFFDGNLFGVFYPAASSVLIYDAETEPTAPALISKRATLEQSFSKLAGHQGTTIKHKEDTSSVLQNKKIFIDLYELGEISSVKFLNFGKQMIVFGKIEDNEIGSNKGEETSQEEDGQTKVLEQTIHKKTFPKLRRRVTQQKTISLLSVQEPLLQNTNAEGKVEGPEKDQLNDSFLSHDEEVVEKFKGGQVQNKVWIFDISTLRYCSSKSITIDSSKAIAEMKLHPNQNNVKYSNTGKYLIFFGKGGFTLVKRVLNGRGKEKVTYVKRRIRIKEKYAITNPKSIVFSDNDEFLAVALVYASRTVIFDLRKDSDDEGKGITMHKLTKCTRLKEFPLVFTFINNHEGYPKFISVTHYSNEHAENRIVYYDISKTLDNCPKIVGPTFNAPMNPVLISSVLTTTNKLLVSRTILVEGKSKHHRMKTIKMMVYNFGQYARVPYQYFLVQSFKEYNDNSPESTEKKKQLAHQKLVNILRTLKEDQVLIDERILYILYVLDKPGLISEVCIGRANLNSMFSWHKLLELIFNTDIPDRPSSLQTVADLLQASIKKGRFPKINEKCIMTILELKQKRINSSESRRQILSHILFASTTISIHGLVKDRYESLTAIHVKPDKMLNRDMVERISKPLLVKEPNTSQEYQVFRSKVQIELTNGSPASLGLIEAIMLMPDEEIRFKYRQLINYKWKMVYKYIYAYLFIYILLNVLVYIHFGYTYDWKLGVCIFCLNVQFLTYNAFCVTSEAGLFVRDLNYWLDLLVHGTCITCLLVLEFSWIPLVHDYARLIAITAVSIRGISLLKMFGPLRMLIKMIGEILSDLIWVPFVLISILLLAGTLYKVTPLPGGNQNNHLNFLQSIQQVFFLIFLPGQATKNEEKDDDGSSANILRSIIIIVFGTFLAQGIFNFIIAIFLQTFKKVNEDREIYEIKSMLLDIRDVDMFLRRFYEHGWFRKVKNYYLFLVPVPKDGKILENTTKFDKAQDIIQGVSGELGKRSLEILEKKLSEQFKDRKDEIHSVVSSLQTYKKEPSAEISVLTRAVDRLTKGECLSKEEIVETAGMLVQGLDVGDDVGKGIQSAIDICVKWDKDGTNKPLEALNLIKTVSTLAGDKNSKKVEILTGFIDKTIEIVKGDGGADPVQIVKAMHEMVKGKATEHAVGKGIFKATEAIVNLAETLSAQMSVPSVAQLLQPNLDPNTSRSIDTTPMTLSLTPPPSLVLSSLLNSLSTLLPDTIPQEVTHTMHGLLHSLANPANTQTADGTIGILEYICMGTIKDPATKATFSKLAAIARSLCKLLEQTSTNTKLPKESNQTPQDNQQILTDQSLPEPKAIQNLNVGLILQGSEQIVKELLDTKDSEQEKMISGLFAVVKQICNAIGKKGSKESEKIGESIDRMEKVLELGAKIAVTLTGDSSSAEDEQKVREKVQLAVSALRVIQSLGTDFKENNNPAASIQSAIEIVKNFIPSDLSQPIDRFAKLATLAIEQAQLSKDGKPLEVEALATALDTLLEVLNIRDRENVQRLKDLAAKLLVFLKRQDEGKNTVKDYLECVSECIATFLPKRKKELTLVVDSVALLESISLEKKVDVEELVLTGVRICTAIDPSLQLQAGAAVEVARSIQTALQIDSSQDFKKLATSLIRVVELTRKEPLPASKSVLAAIDSLSQLSFSGRSLPEGILKSTEAAALLIQTFVPESEPKLDLLKKILTTLQSFIAKESQFTRPSEFISQISQIIKLISADYDESLERIESITNSVENFKFGQLGEDGDESKKIEGVASAIESVGKMLAAADPSCTNGVDQMVKVSRIFVKKVTKKKGLGAKECRLDLIEVINDLSSVLVEYDEGLALAMDKARLFANVVLRKAKALQYGITHNDFEKTISSCTELILAFDPEISEEVNQTCNSLRIVWGLYETKETNSDRSPLERLAYIMERTTKLVSSIDASIEPVCSIASKVSVDIYRELRETSTDGNQNHIQTICTLLASIGKTLVNFQPDTTMVLEKAVSIIRCLEQLRSTQSGAVETSYTSLRICEEIAGVVANIEPALATRTSKLATYLTAVRAAVEEGNNPAEDSSAKLYKAVTALLQDMNPEIKETISKVDSCLNALLTQLRNTKKLRSDKSSELVRSVQAIFAGVDERISKKLEGVYFAVKAVEESKYSSAGDKDEEEGHFAMLQLAKVILPKYSNRLDQLERFFTASSSTSCNRLSRPT